MKTYKHLYPQIYTFANLERAYRRARKGKRDKDQVMWFEFNVEDELIRLQEELASQTYRPGPYRHFYITEPKVRKISAAPFRDRVVHHALCQIIEPIFERRFIFDSYACRIGKGTHRALDRAQEFAREHRYALKCDIRQCFPSIDHAILRDLLARPLADPDVLWLIDQILNSGASALTDVYEMQWYPGDDLFAAARPRGLPIGNLTSQFWANVYLNELDQFVKRELKCRAYVRYVDDFLLFADDKATLHEWKSAVREFLARLRLTMHERKSVVFPAAMGFAFLGFRVYLPYRRLRRENVRAFVRRFRRLQYRYATGALELADLDRSAQAWIAHAAHGNTDKLRARLFRQMPFAPGVALG
ncbi:MAG: reverse transcriptase domain-containing protein [Chloroflexota bacterium]